MKNQDYRIDDKAKIAGAKYQEDKPWSCEYCYWWTSRKRGCCLAECHYLIKTTKQKPKTEKGNCDGCPYGRNRICIGYCIAKIQKEMREKRSRNNESTYEC